MKKILVLIITCFFSLNIVYAKDDSVGKCQYTLDDGVEVKSYAATLKEDESAIISYADNEVLIVNYNSVEVPNSYCGNVSNEYKPYGGSTPAAYIQGGKGCPTYIHIGYDSNVGYYGFFSEDEEPDCQWYLNGNHQVLKNNPTEVNKNEQTGVTTPKDDTFILNFSGEVKQIKVEFEITVNKTKNFFTLPDGNGDYTMYGEYDDYGSFEKVFVCTSAHDPEIISPSMTKFCEVEEIDEDLCNLNYLDNCGYIYSKTSENYLITEGCPLYNRYYTSYQDTKDNDNLVKLKNYCQSVTNSHDYSENKYSCINLCLNISDYLPELKTEDDRCGFSWDLINFIANIIKWGKYLVPVIVMVFGILDFIKAIAADKEDEMKKAQGRFVKRLIAAALIFIIPFIIEFVLDKLGFDAFGCGIIDL